MFDRQLWWCCIEINWAHHQENYVYIPEKLEKFLFITKEWISKIFSNEYQFYISPNRVSLNYTTLKLINLTQYNNEIAFSFSFDYDRMFGSVDANFKRKSSSSDFQPNESVHQNKKYSGRTSSSSAQLKSANQNTRWMIT